MSMTLVVDTFVRSEGTVLVFEGYDPTTDKTHAFVVDHRLGWELADALVEARGQEILVGVEAWQIIG